MAWVIQHWVEGLLVVLLIPFFGWIAITLFNLNREMGEVKSAVESIRQIGDRDRQERDSQQQGEGKQIDRMQSQIDKLSERLDNVAQNSRRRGP